MANLATRRTIGLPDVRVLVATLANALATLGPQLIGLVLLSAGEFGQFSLVYLVFALGSSLTYSVLAEAGGHAAAHDTAVTSRYLAATAWFATLLALPAAGVAWAGDLALVPGVASVLAVVFSTYRVGARYREMACGQHARAIRADVAAAVAIAATAPTLAVAHVDSLSTVCFSWLAAGGVATLAGMHPPLAGPRALTSWVSAHRGRIRVLLKDSLVLDASSIGTPYLVAPFLGIADFGVYRAVSNVAAPARLILNPLRPVISTEGRRSSASGRRLLVVALLAGLLGLAAVAALALVDALELDLGVLSDLTAHATAAGLFVSANVAGHYAYLVARAHAPGSALWRGRAVQSAVAVALPLAGAVTGALSIAIWAYVGSTIVGALAWVAVLRTLSREDG